MVWHLLAAGVFVGIAATLLRLVARCGVEGTEGQDIQRTFVNLTMGDL